MTAITGTFSNKAEAEKAISDLEASGIKSSEISLIVSEATRQKMFNDNVTNEERASSSVKSAGSGAVLGGALGALVAGLTAVGAIVVPGIGFLAAGPIVAIFMGAGAGAATGTLAGALVGAGIPDAEANEYEKALKSNKALVIVHTDDVMKAGAARDIFRAYNSFYKAA